MDTVDQLFMAGKFDPLEDNIPTLKQFLALAKKDLQKQKKHEKRTKGKETVCIVDSTC